MYQTLKKFRKFTTKDEIDKLVGSPKCQIEDRLLYYYGKGIFIAYSPRCFKVVGCERIEYGDEGLFAVNIYHFADVEMLKECLNLSTFEEDDIEKIADNVIDKEVTYDMTFSEIHKLGLGKKYVYDYSEGETRVLANGKMKVQNLFIMCGNYTLFFRGKSKKSKLSGFEYTLCE